MTDPETTGPLYVGARYVLNVQTPKPIRYAPPGKMRIRMREGEFAMLYVRPPEGGVMQYCLTDEGDYWLPKWQIAANRIPERAMIEAKEQPYIGPND